MADQNLDQQDLGGSDIYLVEAIREKIIDIDGITKYQIKWEGYPEEQNTWEPIENLRNIMNMVEEFEKNELAKNIKKKEVKAKKFVPHSPHIKHPLKNLDNKKNLTDMSEENTIKNSSGFNEEKEPASNHFLFYNSHKK